MIYLAALIVLFLIMAMGFGWLFSAPKYQGTTSDHFNGTKFKNLNGVEANGLKDLLKWVSNRQPGPWSEITEPPAAIAIASKVDGPDARITFVNHSTFLIQVDGLNILTDPVWSKRVSPFTFVGPKRMRPPGVAYEDLPQIDWVVISHNHYDHLDIATLKRLYQDHKPNILTPLGVAAYLEQHDIPATDLDWWQQQDISDAAIITNVPAQHFSGRGMFDRDATLWCGYVFSVENRHIYFAGDTGYGPFVHDIAQRFQPMEVALLPIGAYLPIWFMSPIHTSPADAVQMHKDLKSKQSIGIHYGTFPLADDGQTQPLEDLEQALREQGIDGDSFITLPEGGHYQVVVDKTPTP